MPSNTTLVCFDCRTALRRPRLAPLNPRSVVCPKCGRKCINVSKKIAIPPKSNARAWKALREKIRAWQAEDLDKFYKYKVRQRHELERQIAAIKLLPTNEGRNKSIKELRKACDNLVGAIIRAAFRFSGLLGIYRQSPPIGYNARHELLSCHHCCGHRCFSSAGRSAIVPPHARYRKSESALVSLAATMQGMNRRRIGITSVLLIAASLATLAWLLARPQLHVSRVYCVSAQFAQMPIDDEPLKDWLKAQDGVVAHTVVTKRLGGKLYVLFIMSQTFSGRPPFPDLSSKCAELGYGPPADWKDATPNHLLIVTDYSDSFSIFRTSRNL